VSQPSSASPGQDGVSQRAEPTADDWNDDEWPDDLPPPPPPGRRLHPAILVTIGLTAAAFGAAVVLMAHAVGSSPAAPASQPTVQAPAQPGGNAGPGGGAVPGQGSVEMFIGGQVSAVSSTSITIEGPGHNTTAEVTSSTRFTGKVSTISGIKVGDQVSAQLTQSGKSIVAVSISDPAQSPTGGGLP
jgi:hypothetical protein